MAEFMEVMKATRRMCESINKCSDCPLMDASTELCYLDKCPEEYNDSDFIQHEAIIMKWAAEPREYPTWREWQQANFPNKSSTIHPCKYISYTDAHCSDYKDCGDCANQPIPADIAKKLGVQPITKANDTTTKEASQ